MVVEEVVVEEWEFHHHFQLRLLPWQTSDGAFHEHEAVAMEVNDEDEDCLDDEEEDAFVDYLHDDAFVDSKAVVLAVVVASWN